MAQEISRRFFALCLAIMVLAVSAHAQDYKPLIGNWNMVSESDGDPVKWTLIRQGPYLRRRRFEIQGAVPRR
jgi:hypothetical protein